jgi:hypothetical protein
LVYRANAARGSTDGVVYRLKTSRFRSNKPKNTIKLECELLYSYRYFLASARHSIKSDSELLYECHDFIKPERDLLFAYRQTLKTCRDFSATARQTSASALDFIKP